MCKHLATCRNRRSSLLGPRRLDNFCKPSRGAQIAAPINKSYQPRSELISSAGNPARKKEGGTIIYTDEIISLVTFATRTTLCSYVEWFNCGVIVRNAKILAKYVGIKDILMK